MHAIAKERISVRRAAREAAYALRSVFDQDLGLACGMEEITGAHERPWLDVVFDLVGTDDGEEEEGAPEYTDAYAKADWSLDERTDIGVWALWADDSLASSETEDDGVVKTRSSVSRLSIG